MKQDWYIVRHRKTGAYMPEMGRGYTYWEAEPTTAKPRLFPTARGARMAIQAWARGEHKTEHRQSVDWGGYDEGSFVGITPGTERDAAQLEVQPVSITLVGAA
jgi:hypothetical protein